MKLLPVLLALVLTPTLAFAAETPKKATPKPAPKPAAKPVAKPVVKRPAKPRAAPVPSRKDMAIKEAATYDKDKDGKFSSLEGMALNQAFKANPDSFFYLLDENENKYLDSAELAKVPLPPPAKKK
jgi:hypothetical protein